MGSTETAFGPDVAGLVFLRLPQKDLARCKSVCKAWYYIISDRYFAAEYRRALHHDTFYGFFAQVPSIHDLLRFVPARDGPSPVTETELVSSFDRRLRNVILASSGGVLLCSATLPGPTLLYYVCNPLTRERRRIPSPPEPEWLYPVYGFVCQGSSGDGGLPSPAQQEASCHGEWEYRYEVVCVVPEDQNVRPNTKVQIQTYSSSSRKWSECWLICGNGAGLWNARKVADRAAVIVKGWFYWLSNGASILAYHPSAAILRLIPFPPQADPDAEEEMTLTLHEGAGGTLSCCAWDSKQRRLDIWVLLDGETSDDHQQEARADAWFLERRTQLNDFVGDDSLLLKSRCVVKAYALIPEDPCTVYFVLCFGKLVVYDCASGKVLKVAKDETRKSSIKSGYYLLPYYEPSWCCRFV